MEKLKVFIIIIKWVWWLVFEWFGVDFILEDFKHWILWGLFSLICGIIWKQIKKLFK